MTSALAVLGGVERRLALVTTVAEAKAIRDEAETLRVYAQRARKGLRVQNRVALTKLLAERRAGELLASLERAPGKRTDRQPAATVAAGSPYRRALDENQLAERTAERWQLLAVYFGEATLRRYCLDCTEAGAELTSRACYEQARQARDEETLAQACPGAAQLQGAQAAAWRALSPAERAERLAKRRERPHLWRNWLRPVPRRTTLHVEFDRPQDCREAAERLDRFAYSHHTGRAGALQWLLDRYALSEGAP